MTVANVTVLCCKKEVWMLQWCICFIRMFQVCYMDVSFSTKDWTATDEDLPTAASSLVSPRALSNTGDIPINSDSPAADEPPKRCSPVVCTVTRGLCLSRPRGRAPRCLPSLQEWTGLPPIDALFFDVAVVIYRCRNNVFRMLQSVTFMMQSSLVYVANRCA
jgi:hypothetical protein